jgi:hypothetical protein
VLQEPTYPDAVLARHPIHAQAVNARVTKMVTSLAIGCWAYQAKKEEEEK